MADSNATLDVAQTLAGKNIVLMGSTGFVGKVALTMFLDRYPDLGQMFVLVRPGMGNTAEERFFSKVVTSPAFDPLREKHGDRFDDFVRAKVTPIPGDIGRPLCNFTDEQFEEFDKAGGAHCLINSAGLVSFTPSLEAAIRINTMGAKNALEAARRAGARLLHVSTCYVAGRRDGEVWEDEPVIGYFPRRDELIDDDFDAEAELADCQRIIDTVRERAKDRAHISRFRERAAAQLEEEGRNPDDPKTLALAVARQRKIWVHEKLTELGGQRAEHWGWTNTYTYTKSLGEQIVLADKEVPCAVVRPAIVESSRRYPFPGWNEGFNTTAPLMYLMLKGQRNIMMAEDKPLDVVPVDYVAGGIVSATAALLDGSHEPVYQACSSHQNPVTGHRLAELTALCVRRHFRSKWKAGEDSLTSYLRQRLESRPVTPERFERVSAPQFKRALDGASRFIDKYVPSWGAPRVQALAERARTEIGKASNFVDAVNQLTELFKPFTYDLDITYRSDNLRELYQRLAPADQDRLPWDIETLDWREYWMNIHFPGLQKWTFDVLDDEFGPKPRSVYTYKDLVELFEATCRLHRHRVAFRLLRTRDEDAPPDVYTYERVHDMAMVAAAQLRERGIEAGDRVLLMSENRPEWGIAYFGTLLAAATSVPVDAQLSLDEVANLLRASGAKIAVVSPRVARRLLDPDDKIDDDADIDDVEDAVIADLRGALAQRGCDVEPVALWDLFQEPATSPGAFKPTRLGDKVASIIYTSGTTGEPKGVMLTHKNLTSMVSKLSSVFRLYKHDGLLSVLPLHHTFEFSAGLLMPLSRGARISYLDEVGPDALSDALAEGDVTCMVGVPALWQALHRKIKGPVNDLGPVAERLFDSIVSVNRKLRQNLPYQTNLGRALFFPVHGKLGGRLRLLISGGSALPDDVMKTFQGLGFNLFEGYGMTESSPVLTVQRPGETTPLGSVGRPLPGLDIKIADPDESGVGEVLARGPNVMAGYYQNDEATARTVVDGWLHTGDLGRVDDEGNLYIVGRRKEMILGTSGENVYPDELEEVYRDSQWVKELSIVGLPAAGTGETVACLCVPDYEADGLTRSEVQERVREHFKNVSNRLPQYKRVKVLHLWDHDLPKTATRKVKRREVVTELVRLEERVAEAAPKPGSNGAGRNWVHDVLAQVTQKPKAAVRSDVRLDELGFDSLMFAELGVALEAAGLELPDASEVNHLETVADVERFVAERPRQNGKRKRRPVRPEEVGGEAEEIHVPDAVSRWGRVGLRRAQRALYENVLESRVTGRAYVPPRGGFIAVANHSSHLDMGLVKHALGEQGDLLVALAAKDYFFDDPVRRAYFENFTNLVPMERHGSLRESLRMAEEVVREGYILLIFPEGTRSSTGVMTDFKPSIGYLASKTRAGILPMYLGGCHDAMPKGAVLPKQRQISAHVGPFVDYPAVQGLMEGKRRSEAYRAVATDIERRVRALAPQKFEWTLGEAGRLPVSAFEELRAPGGAS